MTHLHKPDAAPKIRPSRIVITYSDPFDGTLLCVNDFLYEPRRASDGFYTRSIQIMKTGLKKIQSHILEGRDPVAKVELIP